MARVSLLLKTWITVIVAGAAFILILWSQAQTLGPATAMRALGFGLLVAGFPGWAAVRIQLGKSFSVRAKASELVTRGIYSKIRNPVYVFGTVLIVGSPGSAGRYGCLCWS